MNKIAPTDRQIQTSLSRLLPRLEERYSASALKHPKAWKQFIRRLEQNFPRLFELYFSLYSNQYDFFFHLEDLVATLASMWLTRPADLQDLDAAREADSDWFLSNQMLGGVAYVDLFAGNLEGIRQKIPYFKELGMTYLHLMPLFMVPDGENDGGYAVSSYRDVNPTLWEYQGSSISGARAAPEWDQPGAGSGLQPYIERASMGVAGDRGGPGLPGLLPDVHRPARSG